VELRRTSEAVLAALSALACLVFLAVIPASVALHRQPTVRVELPRSIIQRSGVLAVAVTSADAARPIVGATVRVFWADGRKYYLAGARATDPAGRAVVPELPEGALWVLVDAPGFARRSTALVLGASPRDVGVTLEAAHVLHVAVEDDAHAPLPNATVLVNGSDALPFGALTDASGKASLERLGRAPWKLRVTARGYESEVRSDVVGDVTVTLRRASVIDVLVTDAEGRPASGATVFVAGSGLWPARTVLTAGDGHARVPGLEAGSYDLKAERSPLVSRTELGLVLERGETHAVTLVIEPGRMIPIVVTDGEGDHPIVVPNADVLLVEGGVSSFPIQGRTSKFGTVTLGPVPPGQFVAAARADGFVARASVAVPDVVTSDVRIPLLRGATLRGEVVDADGRPVDGATIEVVGTDLDGMPIAATPLVAEFQRAHFQWALSGPSPLLPAGELGVTTGPVPPIPAAAIGTMLPAARLSAEASAEPWVTGFDGAFRAAPVPPGRVRALVRHPSYVESTSDMVTLAPGATGSVRVTLLGGGAVEGTVVDESGIPVAGARIEVAAMQGTLSRAATTADDGTFAFATLPAEVLLSLSRPDEPFRPVVQRRVQVPDGRGVEVALVLPALRAPLEISAEDDSERPVKMAQVTVLSLDPEKPLRVTAFTDDAGRAIVKDAVGLGVRVVVEAPGFARWVRQLDAAPESVTAELVSGVLIEGRVTAVRGRRDVDGATVELFSDGRRRTAVTDARGVYRLADVTPGPVTLTVSHPDFATEQVDVVVEATGRPDRAFDVEPIDLADPGAVEGLVVDAAGRGVAGARVGIGVVGAYVPVGTLAGTATTRPDGSFLLERLRPGPVDLGAYAAGVGRGRVANVVVESGRKTLDVTIRLDAATDEADPAATGGVAVTLLGRRQASVSEIVVAEVAPGSEAERAGLAAGDVVSSVDRAPAVSLEDARRRLAGPDGSDVVVEVVRAGAPLALRVRRERVRR
jgi:protocatechuate 3,4-dioxygenase beta subunit